jgi:TATA-box binding protein (TBP) (component of TFIID and TFIIIB)
MYNYKIKISCTSEDKLCYNNKKISNKNYNKPNFEELMNKIEYIETALILYKNFKKFTTKSLEFMCKCDNEIYEYDFKKFIESMKNIGFKSNNDNTIKLIKINKPNELILTYKFQLETKEPNEEYLFKKNKSTYSTQFLYKKNTTFLSLY